MYRIVTNLYLSLQDMRLWIKIVADAEEHKRTELMMQAHAGAKESLELELELEL